MKSLFFAGMLLIASASTVYAQQTTATATVKTQLTVTDDVKRTFLSNINKLDAYTSREVTAQADEAYNALVAAMKTDIDKSAGKPAYAEKQKLFNEIQTLNNNRKENRTFMKTKLQDFHKLME